METDKRDQRNLGFKIIPSMKYVRHKIGYKLFIHTGSFYKFIN